MSRLFWTAPPKILMHNSNPWGGGQFRILQPASLLRQLGYATAQAHIHILPPEVLEALNPDVVVFQFWQTDDQIAALRTYRKTLKKAFFVYENDDLFWRVPDASVHKSSVPHDVKDRIKTAAQICDAITVPTEALAKEMRRLTNMKGIRIQPNEVPRHFINAALAGRRAAEPTSTKPRVGWAGGVGHTGDLAVIAEAMHILGDTVHWVFMGMAPPGVDMDAVEYHPAADFHLYPERLGAMKLDLALAPLADLPFNHCKSDLRVLEYGAAGFPVLASDIITYRDCPVRHVPNNPLAWAAAIREFLELPIEDREDYAQGIHDWVVGKRCMDDNLETRMRNLLPRNSIPFLPTHSHTRGGAAVATVGGSIAGLPDFPSIEAAWEKIPGAHILYVRKGTTLNALQATRMLEVIGGHASVSVMSNDAVYPSRDQFVGMTPKMAQDIDMAAMLVDPDMIQIPCPAGPAILLAASALIRFGLPSSDDIELALLDWGARAIEAGRTHGLLTNTYVHAGSQVPRTQEASTAALRHTVGWVPCISDVLQRHAQSDPLAGVREDLELAVHRICYEAPQIDQTSYATWAAVFDTPGTLDTDNMEMATAGWANGPHISIVLPTYNTPHEWLYEAIESVLSQVYPHWSLLIADDCSTDPAMMDLLESWVTRDNRISVVHRTENGHICRASNDALAMAPAGGWVVFLDHDDTLAPHALWTIAKEIVQHPEARFIYSDSDKLSETSERVNPYYTPDFNYELLLGQNYVTHLAAYRVDAVRAIGGFRPGFEGSQDWDLTFRYLEAECWSEMTGAPNRDAIRHIPHVLYHWRMSPSSTSTDLSAKPYALEAGRRAVMEHLQRTGQGGVFVGPNPMAPIYTMVRFLIPADAPPCVSIIVPTRDNEAMLNACIGTLLARTLYPNYEIIVVDNGSVDPKALTLLNMIQKDKRVRVLRRPEPFNYAAMNNEAVRDFARGKFVCLLNDDTEVVEGSWLNDLVGLAQRPGVGAVGPKLIYQNGTVQQFGIMIDWTAPEGCKALHAFQQLPLQHPGPGARALITQEFSAITGACMLVDRNLYLKYGGLDETAFPIDYNDVDFCLRLRKAGYRNIASAQALMVHKEGATKKKHMAERAAARVLADEQRLLGRHGDFTDGMWNRNLAFHPHLLQGAQKPTERPWGGTERGRVLLINGTIEDAMSAYHDGALPFCATLDGHHLHITYPRMAHVRPLDLRGPVGPFLEILGKLAVPRVIFCGVGNGTIGALGFFEAVRREGWLVECRLTDTANILDAHISADLWAAVYGPFINGMIPDQSEAAAAD